MKQDTIIGKELVIEFEGGEYEIDGSRSGCPTKVISIPPKKVIAECWGRKEIGGTWYDKYVLKEISPMFNVAGITGWKNWQEESIKIAQIYRRGKDENGREIQGVLSLAIEDIKELLGITVDMSKGIVRKDDRIIYFNENLGKESKELQEKLQAEQEVVIDYYSLEKIDKKELDKISGGERYFLGSAAVSEDGLEIYIVDPVGGITAYTLYNVYNKAEYTYLQGIRPVLFFKSEDQYQLEEKVEEVKNLLEKRVKGIKKNWEPAKLKARFKPERVKSDLNEIIEILKRD